MSEISAQVVYDKIEKTRREVLAALQQSTLCSLRSEEIASRHFQAQIDALTTENRKLQEALLQMRAFMNAEAATAGAVIQKLKSEIKSLTKSGAQKSLVSSPTANSVGSPENSSRKSPSLWNNTYEERAKMLAVLRED